MLTFDFFSFLSKLIAQQVLNSLSQPGECVMMYQSVRLITTSFIWDKSLAQNGESKKTGAE